MLLKGDPQSADIRTGRLTVATATQLAGGWSSHCSYCGRFITADGCPKGCSTAKGRLNNKSRLLSAALSSSEPRCVPA